MKKNGLSIWYYIRNVKSISKGLGYTGWIVKKPQEYVHSEC